MRNLKRALSLALAAIMVLGLMVVGASAASTYDNFTDKDEIVNQEAVNTMVSLGVLAGKDDGSYFDPTGIVTRGEMAKIVAVCLNGGKDLVLGDSTNIPKFSDVPTTHWAYNYIAYCVQQGIIAGRGDGTFAPDDPVTGSAAAKMFLCALGYRADLEGLVGNEWELNTNILANQDAKLYDGLETINASAGLSRDNTAQMAYNAVQAQEVTYNNLQGDYSGVLQTTGIGTMLTRRFRVVKVEGVVEANEIFALDGAAKTVAGKASFVDCNTYTDANGAVHPYDDIYPVSIDNDMVGRRVVIYVQFQNDLAPNASSSKIVGEPILSEENTVVTTASKMATADKVKSFLSENNLVMGAYNPDAHGVGISTGNNWVSNANTIPTLESGVIATAGQSMTFIDNDGDNVVDYVISELAHMGTVTVYDETNEKLTISGIGSVDFKNIANPEDVAKDDVVLHVKYGDTYYLTKAETVTGTFDAYNADTSKLRMDGTEYGISAVPLNNSGTPTLDKYTANKDLVGDSYTLYLDFYGNAVAQELNEETLGNYAVVLDSADTTNASVSAKGEVKLLMADGTIGTYSVNLLASANNFGGLGADTNSAKETRMAAILNSNNNTQYGDYTTVTNMIVTYSISGSTVTLSDPSRLNDYNSTYANFAGDVLRSNTSYTDNAGTPNDNTDDTTVTTNDRTIYFFVDISGNGVEDAKVVVGQSNLPNSAVQKHTGADPDVWSNATVQGAVWDNRTAGKVAAAVVVDGVYTGTDNYLYVVKDELQTKDENGETIYTYSVVFDNGEAGEVKVRGGKAEGEAVVSGNVYAYTNDGSYAELKGLANTAGFGKNNTINGFVTTYAIGNTIDIAWGIRKDALSKSMNLADDVKVINVEGDEPATVTGVGKNCSVAMATNSDGLVKVIFVKDSDVDFRTVKNSTGDLNIMAGTVNANGYPEAGNVDADGANGVEYLYTLVSGGTMQTAFGFSVKANNATASVTNAMTYVITPENGTKVTTETADSNANGEVGFTMPDYATVEITDVVGVVNPGDLSTAPVVTAAGKTVSVNGGELATVTVTGGTTSLTYKWFASDVNGTKGDEVKANDGYTVNAGDGTLSYTGTTPLTAGTLYFLVEVTNTESGKLGNTVSALATVTVTDLAEETVNSGATSTEINDLLSSDAVKSVTVQAGPAFNLDETELNVPKGKSLTFECDVASTAGTGTLNVDGTLELASGAKVADLTIGTEGSLTAGDDMEITNVPTVNGELTVDGNLKAEAGIAGKGTVTADTVSTKGAINGTVNAATKLELKGDVNVYGTVTTALVDCAGNTKDISVAAGGTLDVADVAGLKVNATNGITVYAGATVKLGDINYVGNTNEYLLTIAKGSVERKGATGTPTWAVNGTITVNQSNTGFAFANDNFTLGTNGKIEVAAGVTWTIDKVTFDKGASVTGGDNSKIVVSGNACTVTDNAGFYTADGTAMASSSLAVGTYNWNPDCDSAAEGNQSGWMLQTP